MNRRLVILSLIVMILVALVATQAVWGKAHVPAGQVQLSHKGRTAINVDAPALQAHIGHGDVQLPACDFANVFPEGADTSNVISSDLSGVTYSDRGFVPRVDAGGLTPACPPGLF